MKKLTIFYDPDDSRARAVRGFLARHATRIEVEVFPIDAHSVRMCFPELGGAPSGAALVTLSDTGMLEHGEAALRTILWSLENGARWHRFGGARARHPDFERAVEMLLAGRCSIEEDPAAVIEGAERANDSRSRGGGGSRARVVSGTR